MAICCCFFTANACFNGLEYKPFCFVILFYRERKKVAGESFYDLLVDIKDEKIKSAEERGPLVFFSPEV